MPVSLEEDLGKHRGQPCLNNLTLLALSSISPSRPALVSPACWLHLAVSELVVIPKQAGPKANALFPYDVVASLSRVQ